MNKKLLMLSASVLMLSACTNNSQSTKTPRINSEEVVETLDPVEKENNFVNQESDLMNYTSLMSDEKIEEINVETLIGYIDNSDANEVIYIGTPYCSHCVEAAPVIQNTANKYQVDVKYIPFDSLSEEECAQLLAAIDPITVVLDEETGEKAIPMPNVFAIVNGELSQDLSENGYSPETNYDDIFAAVSEIK